MPDCDCSTEHHSMINKRRVVQINRIAACFEQSEKHSFCSRGDAKQNTLLLVDRANSHANAYKPSGCYINRTNMYNIHSMRHVVARLQCVHKAGFSRNIEVDRFCADIEECIKSGERQNHLERSPKEEICIA